MSAKDKWPKAGIIALTILCVFVIAGMTYASSEPAGGHDAGHGSQATMTEHAAGGEHGDAHGGAHSTFSSEKLWDLLWRTVNFAALALILIKFGSKPIASGLRGRKEGIIAKFNELEAQKTEAQKKYVEYEGRLSKIDAEVKKIIESAVAQGEKEKQKIIEEANRMAEDIKRKAESAVQNAVIEARRNLRTEVAGKAVEIAEELIKKKLSDADQTKLIEEYLAKI